jgi:hypothetical protein
MDDGIYTDVVKAASVNPNGTAGALFDYDATIGFDVLTTIYDEGASNGSYVTAALSLTPTTGKTDALYDEILGVIGSDFKLKSNSVDINAAATPNKPTTLIVKITDANNITVTLDYDGDGTVDNIDYQVTE